jgi:anti-sigma regulatory factor (Ser/Thr protein kinase)
VTGCRNAAATAAEMRRLGGPLPVPAGRCDRIGGRAVRRAVRDRAAAVIGDPAVLDDIELMTSEAIANAVLHGSGPIEVAVAAGAHRLLVEVRDAGPARSASPPSGAEAPMPCRPDPDRRGIDHGRGLAVIDALAAEWALERSADGTRLWFVVETAGSAPVSGPG